MVLAVCASGFSDPEKTAIAAKVKQLGGLFTKDLTSDVKVLICSKANSSKYSMSRDVLDIPVVTVDWLDASVTAGHFLTEYAKFGLRTLTNCRLYLHKPTAEVRARAKRLGASLCVSMSEAEIIVTSAKSLRSLPHFYVEDIVVSEEWLTVCEKQQLQVATEGFLLPRPQLPADQSLFLAKCVIFVNTGKEELEELKALISLGGGTWAKQPLRTVTHVISQTSSTLGLAGSACFVSPEWLRQSIRLKRKAPESNFLVS